MLSIAWGAALGFGLYFAGLDTARPAEMRSKRDRMVELEGMLGRICVVRMDDVWFVWRQQCDFFFVVDGVVSCYNGVSAYCCVGYERSG